MDGDHDADPETVVHGTSPSSGPFPATLQRLWAATATDWFPSNPWRLRPGPSILRYLELTDSHATCELWLPIERA